MRPRKYLRIAKKWLTPGMGIKRWLALLACGVGLMAMGAGILLRQLYPLPGPFYYATFQFIPPFLRVGLLIVTGGAAIIAALLGLNRALLEPFGGTDSEVVANAVYYYRQRERGPRVVVIGGGHGLSVLLRGLKRYTSNITAIVTVADDGGSSGRLRRELGVLPPGDFRNCLAALADDEALMTQLFQYRFGAPAENSANGDSGLNGHSFGNLFITAMAEVTGSFERAILESGRVLTIRGRVLPSTLRDVTLMADLRAEPADDRGKLNRVRGESSITEVGGAIERVYLEPDNAPAYPEVIHALLEADLIVAGPGSLYTSILPNLLVPDVARAVRSSRALKVYVCNTATQRGETRGYTLNDHVTALEAHVGRGIFPLVLANDNLDVVTDPPGSVEMVRPEFPSNAGYRVICRDLVDPARPRQHDSEKLARALFDLLKDSGII